MSLQLTRAGRISAQYAGQAQRVAVINLTSFTLRAIHPLLLMLPSHVRERVHLLGDRLGAPRVRVVEQNARPVARGCVPNSIHTW